MAEPNDQDRLDADRFLGRYGEGSRGWERADLIAFIAQLRERYEGALERCDCGRLLIVTKTCNICGRDE